ncbi:MAG: hypothetical protein NXI01_05055 [Gammaproteobacteria bacterium]|nr:hypothetical protein [Gammaproteobacteria bacterium]
MTISNKSPINDHPTASDIMSSENKPVYQKPKTSVFLKDVTHILGGGSRVLEGQGDGYLTS